MRISEVTGIPWRVVVSSSREGALPRLDAFHVGRVGAGDRDLEPAARDAEAPEARGGSMAGEGLLPAGEHRGHDLPPLRDARGCRRRRRGRGRGAGAPRPPNGRFGASPSAARAAASGRRRCVDAPPSARSGTQVWNPDAQRPRSSFLSPCPSKGWTARNSPPFTATRSVEPHRVAGHPPSPGRHRPPGTGLTGCSATGFERDAGRRPAVLVAAPGPRSADRKCRPRHGRSPAARRRPDRDPSERRRPRRAHRAATSSATAGVRRRPRCRHARRPRRHARDAETAVPVPRGDHLARVVPLRRRARPTTDRRRAVASTRTVPVICRARRPRLAGAGRR